MSDFDKIVDDYPDSYLTEKGKAYAEGFRRGEDKATLVILSSVAVALIGVLLYSLFM
jgi:hypothetical protein